MADFGHHHADHKEADRRFHVGPVSDVEPLVGLGQEEIERERGHYRRQVAGEAVTQRGHYDNRGDEHQGGGRGRRTWLGRGPSRAATPKPGSTMAPTRAIKRALAPEQDLADCFTKEILGTAGAKGEAVGPLPGPLDRRPTDCWASQDRWMRHTIRFAAGLGILVGGCVLAACATTPSPDDWRSNFEPDDHSSTFDHAHHPPPSRFRRNAAPPRGGRASSYRT